MRRLAFHLLVLGVFFMIPASSLSAACVNKFTVRSEGAMKTITLLTGRMTFQNAQALAEAIHLRKAPPLELVDDSGKTLAKEYGELKVVRPMPVSCDGNPSGVVMIASFATVQQPGKKLSVKIDPTLTIVFEEQAK